MTVLVRFKCDLCAKEADAPLPEGWARIDSETFVSGKVEHVRFELCDRCFEDNSGTIIGKLARKKAAT
jgi:hypothetical protein